MTDLPSRLDQIRYMQKRISEQRKTIRYMHGLETWHWRFVEEVRQERKAASDIADARVKAAVEAEREKIAAYFAGLRWDEWSPQDVAIAIRAGVTE